MKRRTFFKGVLAVTGTGLLGGLYSWQIEPFWLEYVRVKMPIKNLPPHLVGKTMMQISDIHIGNRFNHQYIIESFEEAATYKPDFVVYTGDFVTLDNGKVLYDKLDEVLEKTVKGNLGTFAIMGNHDYGVNWTQKEVADTISTKLSAKGVEVLRNAKTTSNGLNFIGFDDYWGVNFNPEMAMANYKSNEPTVVLCHNPDVCDLDVWKDYQGWILSGHTHGGQCKPPFLDPPMLPVKNKRYSAGKIDLSNNRTLYINRALGHLWQIRFNVRPEITIFELEVG
jgi:uncharacterized protein